MKKYYKKSCTFLCFLLLVCFLFASCTSDELLKVTGDHMLLHAGVCYSVPGMYESDLRGKSVEILERDKYGRTLVSYVAKNFITNRSELVFVVFQHHEKSKVYYYEDVNYIFDENPNTDKDQLKCQNDWNQPLDFQKCSKREIRVSFDNHLVRDSTFEKFNSDAFYKSLRNKYKIDKGDINSIRKCDSDGVYFELFVIVLENQEKYFCIVDSSYDVFCTQITNEYDFSSLLIDLKKKIDYNK